MQSALLYTVEHTAGSFTGELLRGLSPSNVWLGDAHMMQRGRKKGLDAYRCRNFNDAWLKKYLLDYLTASESEVDFVMFSAHHSVPGSNLVKALVKAPLPLPVVSSVRDPLLVVHTKLWRECAIQGIALEDVSVEYRQELVRKYADLVHDILSVPNGHMFILPVDLVGMQSRETRLAWVKRMLKFCGLPVISMDIAKYHELVDRAHQWARVGDTRMSTHIIRAGLQKPFVESRRYIYRKNKKGIQKYMPYEFNYLNTRDDIKAKMETLGYRYLGWW